MVTRPHPLFLLILVLLAAVLACNIPGRQVTLVPTLAASLTPRPTATPPNPVVVTATAAAQEPVTEVVVYLVALEDNGKSGIPIGCGDSLVEVRQPVDPTTTPVAAALEKLFSYKTQVVGESGLYNALYQSSLAVESVEVGPGGDVNVALTGTHQLGGVCDGPRFQGQIEQTIRTASGASAVNVTINGVPLWDIVSGR